jgi:His-Xaa-Ser system protein HxsD
MVILDFDRAAYSVEAAQAAAYRFIDRLTIVTALTNTQIRCEVSAIPNRQVDFEACVDDFKRELLDQQLRRRIGQETEAVRNLILGLAFSRTGLQS